MAPMQYMSTYLINDEGKIVHKWSKSNYPPGRSVYLLSNGNLLRTCSIRNDSVDTGGGDGGRIEEYNWNDSLIWSFSYSSTSYLAHHDIKLLPNGNILLLAVEKKTISQMLTAGFDTSRFQSDIHTKGYILPDYVIEVQPTYPSGGNIVWEWHAWDHMIQDFDANKSNYGVVSAHPELINTMGGLDSAGGGQLPTFWNHMNSISYDPKFDQILLSCRVFSEIWIIDHSTTTEQAAGHTGGKYGYGGDILYRWGNPICYRMGAKGNEMLFQQHDADWIDTLSPGSRNLLVFNNGLGRNYTSVDQLILPVDSLGFYYRAPGTAFGPANLKWTYSATPQNSFFCTDLGGAQRLPNGNTLIDNGILGNLFEVTSDGQTVWHYVNPVGRTGPLYWDNVIPQDPTHPGQYLNEVFRVQRYSSTYPGLMGKDLTPGDYIELYETSVNEKTNQTPIDFSLYQNYPNPFNPSTKIEYHLQYSGKVKLEIYSVLGVRIRSLVNQFQQAGDYSVEFNGSGLPSGCYFYKLTIDNRTNIKKMDFVK